MVQSFVGNLNWSKTVQDPHSAFAPFRDGASVALASSQGSGRSSGFAFVRMPRATAGRAIAQVHGSRIRDQPNQVREALPDPAQPRQTRSVRGSL